MKSFKWILPSVAIIAVLIAGAYIYCKWQSSEDATRARFYDAKITDISPMLQLCSVEFVEDLPIKASVGSRHLFAQMTVTGSISFDVENLAMENRRDTLVVTLPPEVIEIRESTSPDAYKVIDTWNDKFLGSSKFTTTEENIAKAKVRENYKKSLYSRGFVARARMEAKKNLENMLHAATGRPVIVN